MIELTETSSKPSPPVTSRRRLSSTRRRKLPTCYSAGNSMSGSRASSTKTTRG